MTLVSPFINSVRAFDAEQGTTINLSVLGGDAITKYKFLLYYNDGSTSPFYNSGWIDVQNDSASETIRNFPITLNYAIQGIRNNNSYKIEPYIANDDFQQGLVGQQTLFQCYQKPNILLKYRTTADAVAVYNEVIDGTTFHLSEVHFRLIVAPQLNSGITPNTINTTLYGVDHSGHKHLLTTTGSLYNFSVDSTSGNQYIDFSLGGLSVNVDSNGNKVSAQESLYSYFELETLFSAVDGMETTLVVTNLNCHYDIVDNPSAFNVINVCENGCVQLRYALTNLQATSNPIEPLFLNHSEVDLTDTNAWAQWQRYFTLNQPFTIRLWGRAFNKGNILTLSSTTVAGNYINVKYDTEINDGVEYSFVSLEAGQASPTGDLFFPYYIESERIQTSNIMPTSNLFVGIQRHNNLFNIEFQIL